MQNCIEILRHTSYLLTKLSDLNNKDTIEKLGIGNRPAKIKSEKECYEELLIIHNFAPYLPALELQHLSVQIKSFLDQQNNHNELKELIKDPQFLVSFYKLRRSIDLLIQEAPRIKFIDQLAQLLKLSISLKENDKHYIRSNIEKHLKNECDSIKVIGDFFELDCSIKDLFELREPLEERIRAIFISKKTVFKKWLKKYIQNEIKIEDAFDRINQAFNNGSDIMDAYDYNPRRMIAIINELQNNSDNCPELNDLLKDKKIRDAIAFYQHYSRDQAEEPKPEILYETHLQIIASTFEIIFAYTLFHKELNFEYESKTVKNKSVDFKVFGKRGAAYLFELSRLRRSHLSQSRTQRSDGPLGDYYGAVLDENDEGRELEKLVAVMKEKSEKFHVNRPSSSDVHIVVIGCFNLLGGTYDLRDIRTICSHEGIADLSNMIDLVFFVQDVHSFTDENKTQSLKFNEELNPKALEEIKEIINSFYKNIQYSFRGERKNSLRC